MQTSTNARVALLTWFRSLAPEDRKDLARSVLPYIPGTQVSGDSQDHEPLLIRWIEDAKSLASDVQVGRILATIAAIEFFVMRDRGSEAGWKRMMDRTSAARQVQIDNGMSAARIEECFPPDREFPLRVKRWLAYANDWKKLKRSAFSFQNLECWTRDVDLGLDA